MTRRSASRAAVTKARIFVACWASILVLVSGIYSMTYVFTKQIVKDMVLEQQDMKLNLRRANRNKNLLLEYDLPDVATTMEEEQELQDTSVEQSSPPEVKMIIDKKPAEKKRKEQKEINKDKLKLKKKRKKQIWQEESADIGEITSSGNILNDTTVIVTTNWMPSVPATDQLDKVMKSLSFLHGLPKDAPIVIAVDGAYENGARYESKMNVDMRAYVQAIKAKYDKPHVTIIASDKKIMLVGNMKRALRKVQTKYVLVLQHDLPFINEVNHTALVETMETNSDVRLIRFHTTRVLTRKRDGGICDEKDVDFESENGIKLTKTHIWSDRNHLTRKSYYAEMFQLPGWSGIRNMEVHMEKFGKENCKHWGTYLFGPRGGVPTIFHLDGRGNGQHMTSTKRVFGNLTGLLD